MSGEDEAFRQLGSATGALIALPFRLIAGIFRMWMRWRKVPLHEKNRVRAMLGTAALIGAAVNVFKHFALIGAKPTMAVVGMALLYLVVGVKGSHGASYDFMSAFWYAATALGSVVLLVFIKHHGLHW